MSNNPFYRQTQGTQPFSQGQPMHPLPQIGTTLPTGMPAGTFMSPMPATPVSEQPPQTLQSTAYLPGFLRTQIGRRMRIQFLIGTTGPMVDRIGTLLQVGANYILLRPIDSDDILTADLYSIKFVDIYQ